MRTVVGALLVGLVTGAPWLDQPQPDEGDSKLVSSDDGWELNVVHINDIHAYFEETSMAGTRCRKGDECVGGIARVVSKYKQILKANPTNTIFLNAGDFYQGTVWYSVLKYEAMAYFGNLMNYDAMGLGNHDFDDSVSGLVPFSENVNFPLLASNLKVNTDQLVEDKHFYRSTVIEREGHKIGIIGYITNITVYNFPNKKVEFEDEITKIKEEVKKLKSKGVKIIIALGHSGYEVDKAIAKAIPELDLVVGGHSHTFLYTPENDNDIPVDKPRGEYPTNITPDGHPNKVVPVVQAKCYTKYLGHLKLKFSQGSSKVTFAKPYLLDAKVDPDKDILKEMNKPRWQNKLAKYKEKIAKTNVDLFRRGNTEESNIGNAVTDSMVQAYDDTTIAIVNNEGVRANIPRGDIWLEDIMYVLPFQNTVDRMALKGKELKKALEKAAGKLDNNDPSQYPGFSLQVSGLRLTIDVRANNNHSRITTMRVRNEFHEFEDLIPDKVYNVSLGSFMAPKGRQKHLREIFDDDIHYESYETGKKTDYEVFTDYVRKEEVLNNKLEDRINIQFFQTNSSASTPTMKIFVIVFAFAGRFML